MREYVERNWWWIAVVVALAVGGVLAKWLLPLWPSIGVAVVIALLGVVVHPRASARVIERDSHYKRRGYP